MLNEEIKYNHIKCLTKPRDYQKRREKWNKKHLRWIENIYEQGSYEFNYTNNDSQGKGLNTLGQRHWFSKLI